MDASAAGGGRRPEVRRLTRRTDQKMIAGVAAGLGDYFGVDPVLFRIAFIVGTLFGGAGLLAYLLAWFIMPEGVGETAPGDRLVGRMSHARINTWLGIFLLILGTAWLTGELNWDHSGIIWAFGLIAAGVLLFRHDSQRADEPEIEPPPERPGGGGPASASAAGASAAAAPSGAAVTGTQTLEATAVDTPNQRELRRTERLRWRNERHEARARRRAERPRSALGYLTTSAAFMVIGGTLLADNLGWIHLELVQYFALALATVGAGLLIGTLWGTSRGLIVLGLLLIPLTALAGVVNVPLRGGAGDLSFTPASLEAVRPEYRLAAGRLFLDLTRVPLSGGSIDLEASVGAGELEVAVPEGVTVRVDSHVGLGQITVFGRNQDGLGISSEDAGIVPGSAGELRLDLAAGIGEVNVYRAPGIGAPPQDASGAADRATEAEPESETGRKSSSKEKNN